MQTITEHQIRENTNLLFANYGKEPVLLKSEQNQLFLLLPVNQDKWQETIQQYLISSKKPENSKDQKQIVDTKINEAIYEKNIQTKPASFDEFDKQWCGFMKDVQLPDNWKDDYYQNSDLKIVEPAQFIDFMSNK